MPLLLEPADFGAWLEGAGAIELLRPAADSKLRMWPVSRRVNRTGSGDDDTLLDEVAARPPSPAKVANPARMAGVES